VDAILIGRFDPRGYCPSETIRAVTETLHVSGTRAYAQGEIFLLMKSGDHMDAQVYNTTGFGPCPAAEFGAIDVDALARDTGSDLAWKNARRFWMMDELRINLAGEPAEFGGIKFNLVARMQMPADFDFTQDQSARAYNSTQIRRVSTYGFMSGRPVFLLRSPDETTWVMQTFTNHIDATLTEADLPELGSRLTLADGWQFKAVTLDRDLAISTNGLANIVPDNLSNMYQGCIDGVNNFDPWV
jgi:hypothetical protein